MKRRLALVALAAAACLGPQDDPSQVHDLRVIGVSFEPPEIMAPSCAGLLGASPDAGINFAAFLSFAQPIQMTWLVMDPKGEGRPIEYEVLTCAHQFDLKCVNEGDFAVLFSGTTQPGELKHQSLLAGTTLDDGGTFLLQEVVSQDTYKGLGGIRVPVVLHLKAGEEELYAQKLMVYSCKLFPDQKQNVNPHLPGIKYRDDEWPEGVVKTIVRSDGPANMTPTDLTGLEEEYVVPSLELKPVHLTESWKISWHASLGRFSPTTSGGTDFTGATGKQRSEWLPRVDGGTRGLSETDVNYWFVVRDGRGGESWITRKGHFLP